MKIFVAFGVLVLAAAVLGTAVFQVKEEDKEAKDKDDAFKVVKLDYPHLRYPYYYPYNYPYVSYYPTYYKPVNTGHAYGYSTYYYPHSYKYYPWAPAVPGSAA